MATDDKLRNVGMIPKFFTLASLSLLVTISIFFPIFSKPVFAVDPETLKKYLTVEEAILGVNDNVSLDFQKFDGGSEVSLNSTRSWIPASTIKAYVLIEVYNQVRKGSIALDDTVTIKANNVVPTALETDEFPRLREGTKAKVGQLAQQMIIQSDNTAYNSLLDLLDRRNINITLQNLGIKNTVVGEKLNLDDDQYQSDSRSPGFQNNTTTVQDYIKLFSLLASKKIPNSDDMLAIFKRQKFNDMIPALIPKSTIVAHKTGFWAPIYHDGGIVYKPDDPFILGIFSNANDPSVNSRLAKVAYYQNADSVSASTTPGPDEVNSRAFDKNYPVITLASGPSENELKVLGATTSNKSPDVTAADLGITIKDLEAHSKGPQNLQSAIIVPGSWTYLLKRGLEEIQLSLARTNAEKATVLLNISHARLSEINSLKQTNRSDVVGQLINDEQSSLSQALALSQNVTNSEQEASQVKQLSDTGFALAGKNLDQTTGADKEKLIDTIYNSYKKNREEIAPSVENALPTSSSNKPLVGTVEDVKNGNITVAFTDGTTKTVLATPDTPSRSFGEADLDHALPQASIGAKIAVVGKVTKTGEIIPNFILRNVPKEIPEKKEGIVIKIDPENSTLEIRQSDGENSTVLINSDTNIKARDTDVSLIGIKAGSTVTIFGTNLPIGFSTQNGQPSTNSGRTRDNGKNNPATPSGGKPPLPSSKSGSQTHEGSNQPSPTAQPLPAVIKATTITVTKNGSGKNEVEQKVPQVETKPSSTPPTTQNNKSDNSVNPQSPPPAIPPTPEKKADNSGKK